MKRQIFFLILCVSCFYQTKPMLKEMCGEIAVINSLALVSAGSCFFGLLKIFNPPVIIEKQIDNDMPYTQASLPKKTTHTVSYRRPLFVRNEVIQGLSFLSIGTLGFYISWRLSKCT
jgi:hypothetical protein